MDDHQLTAAVVTGACTVFLSQLGNKSRWEKLK